MKRSPMPRRKKPMRRMSAKRSQDLHGYIIQRREFLARFENRLCPVYLGGAFNGEPIEVPTRDIHHMAGREGKLLRDEQYWLAVSRTGHRWIHSHPNEARKRGWLI